MLGDLTEQRETKDDAVKRDSAEAREVRRAAAGANPAQRRRWRGRGKTETRKEGRVGRRRAIDWRLGEGGGRNGEREREGRDEAGSNPKSKDGEGESYERGRDVCTDELAETNGQQHTSC